MFLQLVIVAYVPQYGEISSQTKINKTEKTLRENGYLKMYSNFIGDRLVRHRAEEKYIPLQTLQVLGQARLASNEYVP